ncbi:MAG: hypothetical protein IJY62_01700 [Clostridia bacterium]|nr:hypothetical protein [Clostridia bacterium]
MKNKPMTACGRCQALTEIKNARYCPNCGSYECAACTKESGGLCRRCFTPMERLS